MGEDKNMDKLFHDKLNSFEKAPPAFVWDKVQDSLAVNQRKKRLVYWRVAGIAAAVVVAFFTGWQINRDSVDKNEIIVENVVPEINKQITPEIDIEKTQAVAETINESDSESSRPAILPVFIAEKSKTKKTESVVEDIVPHNRESVGFIQSLRSFLNSNTPDTDLLVEIRQAQDEIIFTPEELKIIDENESLIALNNAKKDNGNWMVGAALSPTFSGNKPSHSLEYANNMANPKSANNFNMGGGLSVEYKTKKRWSIQSGLYYSKLNQKANNNIGTNNLYDREPSFASDYVQNTKMVNGSLNMNSVAGVIEIANLPANVQLEGSWDQELAGGAACITD